MRNRKKRTIVWYIAAGYVVLQFAYLLLFVFNKKEKPSADAQVRAEQPAVYPDYRGVTIPANIAPLNFRIEGETESCYASISGSKGEATECFGTNKIQISPKEWRALLEQNAGGTLSVAVATKSGGKWTVWEPFDIVVSDQSIDSHLAYRLIEPGYEKWHIVGIYQRNLESFAEKTIIRNDMTGYNCINCHSFCQNDPQQMMFHMRAANGATYIVRNGSVEKLNTKTDGTISNLTYPYWHPSGRYIATSVNDIKQFFHAVKGKKMEVFDHESDVVVYDVEKREILSRASLITKDAFETFPSFSPDGRWLYFCTAQAVAMPANYDKARYHLCRVAFDADKGEIRMPIDTLVRADSLSTTFPRISPDGRFLMYTETAYGQFPIWHKDAEIRMLELDTRRPVDMAALNSPDTDSYHSWSSNGRWVVVSSRRDNGLYTLPYLCHIALDGRPSKPFLLPQEDPDTYDHSLYSYNLPEFITSEVDINPYTLQHAAKKGKASQVRFTQ